MIDIPLRTPTAVYEAAARCQRDRARITIPVPAVDRGDIEAAYDAWLDWGQDRHVQLRFHDDGSTVLEYVDG